MKHIKIFIHETKKIQRFFLFFSILGVKIEKCLEEEVVELESLIPEIVQPDGKFFKVMFLDFIQNLS